MDSIATFVGVDPGSNPGRHAPQSFLSQIGKVINDSVIYCHCTMSVLALLFVAILYAIVLIAFVTMPIAMIIVGAKYVNDCPVQKMIPISVIVTGCVATLSILLFAVGSVRRPPDTDKPRKHTVIGWLHVAINLFLAAWFVATCYWIYSVKLSTSPGNPNYCNPHLYEIIYWIFSFILSFFGTLVVLSVATVCAFFFSLSNLESRNS